jgi:hypothetical protein
MKSISERIRELHREGKTVSEIQKILSQELGRNIRYQRVYNTLIPLGPRTGGTKRTSVTEQIKECINEGKSVKEICLALGVYPSQVYMVRKKIQRGSL